MNVVIRPATKADLPGILGIVNHAIAHTTAIYEDEARSLQTQEAWFDDKMAHDFPVVVAEIGSEVVGFGAYGTFRVRTGYRFTVEHSVYVADRFQGNGIGRLLLEELILRAKAQNLHIMIGGIDAANAGSIAFHRQLGFAESGTCREVAFKFGKWLDLSLMQLKLG